MSLRPSLPSAIVRIIPILLAALLCCFASDAQRPKVLAPHKPVPPTLAQPQPLHTPAVARSLAGGLWMIDANMKSSLHITNDLVTSSLSVTPVLWLSNGVKYTLPAVNLEPSGTAVVDINQALASQGLASYATLSGYVEIDYSWPWDALCATVVNVDTLHSVIFSYGLPLASPAAQTSQAAATTQTLEGLWWKQEANVTGFVTFINPTPQAGSAVLTVSDAQSNPLGQYPVTVSPHGTKTVDLTGALQNAGTSGGLRVVYNGGPNDLLVSGGLRDDATGYSANIGFAAPPSATSQISTVSYAVLGLMTGAADPMLSFPAGTVFTPYSVARNISSQPAVITPNLWWMAGGTAKNAALPQITLAPLQSRMLDAASMLAQAGLKDYNGSVNLVFDVAANAQRGAVILASGSVDQKNNYVFQVGAEAVKQSIAKSLSYWSIANGDDTMITLWNSADEAQDFLFTLFYAGGGQYAYPIHLEARATQMFNISEIIHSRIPDPNGNLVPLSVTEGRAMLSGPQGEAQYILVNMDAGTYNVQKATCNNYCKTCLGAVNSWVTDDPFGVAVGKTHQLTLTVQQNSGSQLNDTTSASWNSSNTSVASVGSNTGLVNGVAVGSATMNAFDDSYPLYFHQCFSSPPVPAIECPVQTGTGGGSPGNSITVSQSPTILNMSSGDTNLGVTVSVSPSSVASSVVFAQGGVANYNSSSTATFTYNKPTNFTGNDLWKISIGGTNSPSGVQNSQACTYGVCSSQLSGVDVPPQVLIQMIEAEAGGTDSTTMTAVAEVAKNRFGSAVFGGQYTTYQNTIIPGQFAMSATTTGIQPELDIAASVFAGTSAGNFCGALSFWTPTSSQWQTVQTALQSGSTTFPSNTGAPTYSSWDTSQQQILFVPAVGTYSNGVPYFLFLAQRGSTQAAAVNVSCN